MTTRNLWYSRLARYGAAVLSTVLAFLLREALVHSVGELPTYITLYPTVMLVALLAGSGPGMLATALGALAAWYWILPPSGLFLIQNTSDAVGLGLFCAFGVFISLMAGGVRAGVVKSRTMQVGSYRFGRLALIFAGLAAVTLGSTFAVYWMGLRVTAANLETAQSRQILATLETTLSALKDAETGQRGYLLTGDEAYLEPYRAATQQVGGDLDRLQQWAALQEVSPQEAETVARLVREKLSELVQTVELQRAAGAEAALDVVRSGVGKRTMDELRQHVAAMETQEDGELHYWQQRRDMATTLRTTVVIAMSLVELAFLFWAFRRIAAAAAVTQRQKELLGVTLASIGDAVIVSDTQGNVTFLNGEAERVTGWTSKEAVGQPLSTVFRIINEHTRQTVESPVDKVLRLGNVVGLANHTVLLARDGREIPIDDSGAPIRQSEGTVHGVVLVFRDISERRAAEAAQQRQARELAESVQLLDLASVMVRDPVDRITRWNTGCQRLYGFSDEQAVGRISHELLKTRFPLPLETVRAVLLQTGRWEGELTHTKADGLEIQVKSEWVVFSDQQGQASAVLEVNTDITERKRAEEALRQSEQRFRTMADAMPQLAWIANPDGWINWYNVRWYEYTGTTPQQMEGWGWQSVHDPEVLPRVMERWKAAIAAGEPFDMTFPLRGADGVFRPFLTRAVPLKDAEGRIVQWFGTNTDISEQKATEAELAAAKVSAERAKAAAEEASRAKDHFLAVLSHELRTPLTPVLATAAMLENEPGLSADMREALEVIRRNTELEARLIDDLLDLTRIARGKIELNRRPVEIASIIDRAVEVCRPDIEARRLHFGLDVRCGRELVNVDGARMQQVFWNLLKNAIKFTPESGCMGIRCWRDDNQVVAEVTDSGIGIARQSLERIFKAFEQVEQTTSRRFGGLGLGLAISKALVELHGGTIAAASAGEGKGATFTVRLPLAIAPTAQFRPERVPARGAKAIKSRPLRILLVEDHGDTARIIARLLKAAGHEVHTAGDVAMALAEASRREFDLLISDIGLPDGSGVDLMRELRARGTALPGIAMTGFGQQEDVRRTQEAGFTVHLTKPIDFQQLEQTIAGLSGEKGS